MSISASLRHSAAFSSIDSTYEVFVLLLLQEENIDSPVADKQPWQPELLQ